ncbi:MAG: glycosyltransferase, partial [Chloroflexi bacterium]|nr:glycosyltransferase [Chloroflexota bacterium]
MARYAQTLAGELRVQKGLDLSVYPEAALRIARRRQLVLVRRALLHPWRCRRWQGQVNHVLDHSYGHLLFFVDPRRTVVTCHDLAPLAYRSGPRPLSLSMLLWRWAFRGTLRAARIIADSASTRSDLARFGGYPAERIDVIPLGVMPAFFAPHRREDEALRPAMAPPGTPLILHVG